MSTQISRASEIVSSPPQIPVTPVKILIVEDEGLVADNLVDILSTDGYRVVGIAESSEGALELVPQLMPELILMDIRIKGSMDGSATAAKLREHFDIPIIYLTRSNRPSDPRPRENHGGFRLPHQTRLSDESLHHH